MAAPSFFKLSHYPRALFPASRCQVAVIYSPVPCAPVRAAQSRGESPTGCGKVARWGGGHTTSASTPTAWDSGGSVPLRGQKWHAAPPSSPPSQGERRDGEEGARTSARPEDAPDVPDQDRAVLP